MKAFILSFIFLTMTGHGYAFGKGINPKQKTESRNGKNIFAGLSKKSSSAKEKSVSKREKDQDQDQSSGNYYYVDKGRKINRAALKKALAYYDSNYHRLSNKDYIVLIDYGKHSSEKRFFLVDMNSGSVKSYLTSHGSGSDKDNDGYAESFSDRAESKQTSLGFFRTGETYSGKHGYSLKLDGLSSSNSSARERAVVIHSASYVSSGEVGRSWGCPALSPSVAGSVIDDIRDGALIYSFK